MSERKQEEPAAQPAPPEGDNLEPPQQIAPAIEPAGLPAPAEPQPTDATGEEIEGGTAVPPYPG